MWVDSAVVIVGAALRLSKYLLLQKVLEPWKNVVLLNNSERPVDALAENGKLLTHLLTTSNREMLAHLKIQAYGSLYLVSHEDFFLVKRERENIPLSNSSLLKRGYDYARFILCSSSI